jgi:hypothetical protein
MGGRVAESNLVHNTTVSRATDFTPFHLLFGIEAMAPEEI